MTPETIDSIRETIRKEMRELAQEQFDLGVQAGMKSAAVGLRVAGYAEASDLILSLVNNIYD